MTTARLFNEYLKSAGDAWSLSIPILKVNDELQIAFGWASVTHENGEIVTDVQGDQIDVDDLVKGAHDFMLESRAGGEMHETVGVGAIVESMVFTPEVQKLLGIDLGKVGWWIGMKISDTAVWKRVKSGELGAFSIGGSGSREVV